MSGFASYVTASSTHVCRPSHLTSTPNSWQRCTILSSQTDKYPKLLAKVNHQDLFHLDTTKLHYWNPWRQNAAARMAQHWVYHRVLAEECRQANGTAWTCCPLSSNSPWRACSPGSPSPPAGSPGGPWSAPSALSSSGPPGPSSGCSWLLSWAACTSGAAPASSWWSAAREAGPAGGEASWQGAAEASGASFRQSPAGNQHRHGWAKAAESGDERHSEAKHSWWCSLKKYATAEHILLLMKECTPWNIYFFSFDYSPGTNHKGLNSLQQP